MSERASTAKRVAPFLGMLAALLLGAAAVDAAPPANDDLASATVVTGAEVRATGNNSEATLEAGEPAHGGNAGGSSVWWSWTPDTSGPVMVDTLVSRFDTLLGVYTGTDVGSLTLVADNDDAGTRLSRVQFDAVAGTAYRIAVDGYEGASGEIGLRITRNVVRVPEDHATIQQALNAALASATVLVAPGIYRETLSISGTSKSLVSRAGPYVTTIMPPVDVQAPAITVSGLTRVDAISGFTIGHDPHADSHVGRGLQLGSGQVSVTGNVIRDNRETGGAGISVPAAGSSPLFLDNRIVDNDGTRVTPFESLGRGGAISVSRGTPEFVDNEISGNRADHVAAIAISGPTTSASFENNLITDNEQSSTVKNAGGFVIDTTSGASVALRQNVIIDNDLSVLSTAVGTAAVRTSLGDAFIEGNLIAGHGQNPLALRVEQPGGASIVNNIFTQPSAPTFGVVECTDGAPAAAFAHNLHRGNIAGLGSCEPFTGQDGNVAGDPLLDPVDGMHPGVESPAVDAGDDALGAELGADLDGNAREIDGNDDLDIVRDMGPFEFHPGGVLAFSSPVYAAASDAGTVTVTVVRLGDTTGEASVRVTTRDGTLAAGDGYTAIADEDQVVNFADGDIAKEITIDLSTANPGVEPDEDFQVLLSEASGAALGRWHKAAVQVIGDRFDLSVSTTAPAGNKITGQDIPVIFRVGNRGNTSAPAVTFSVPISADTELVSATHGGSTCAFDGSSVNCDLGTLNSGQDVVVAATVRETHPGAFGLTGTVTTPGGDLQAGNDSATVEYTVIPGFRLLDYYPVPGAVTGQVNTFDEDGEIHIERVGTARIGGVNVFTSTIGTDVSYFTNDDDGLRYHRLDFRDVDLGRVKVTFDPPMVLGPPFVAIGTTQHSSGIAGLSIPGLSRVNVNYSVTSQVLAEESVTVPAGTFDTLKMRLTLTLSGRIGRENFNESATLTIWLARDVGAVKVVSDFSGETTTEVLLGYTPELLTPAPGATLTASSQVFSWALNGTPAERVRLLVGTRRGRGDIFDSRNLDPAVTEVSLDGLPADGTPIHVRLRFLMQRKWYHADYLVNAADFPFPELTTPEAGTTLMDSAVVFGVTDNGHAVQNYCLYVGNRAGRSDVHNSGCRLAGDTTSIPVGELYADGRPLHVRLRAKIRGRWYNADYEYTAADFPLPELTSPVAGTTFTGNAATFDITDNGHAVQNYCLFVGNRAGRSDVHNSGCRLAGDTTSIPVGELYADGRPLHVRLRAKIRGRWYNADYEYTAADFPLPELTSPVAGTTFTGNAVTFDITDNGHAVQNYCLYVGNRAGRSDVHNSGCRLAGDTTSIPVGELYADGRPLHVRLRAKIRGRWYNADYEYTAADFPLPELTSPVAGTTFTGNAVTFDITDNGHAVQNYCLYVGNRAGRSDVHNSGCRLAGDTTSIPVGELYADGRPLHARLRAKIRGRWYNADYEYTAADLPFPELTSPGTENPLAGSAVTFDVTDNGHAVQSYCLFVGNRVGRNDVFNGGCRLPGDTTSIPVGELHADGRPLHVRLRAKIRGRWYNADYEYMAADLPFPQIASPETGTPLAGPDVTFALSSGGQAVELYCLFVGRSPGRREYFNSGCRVPGDATSVEAIGLPIDGRDLHVRLRARILGRWHHYDVLLQAATP